MKSLLVALFFVALASAQVDNANFIQRQKRQTQDEASCAKGAESCCVTATDEDCKDCSSLIVGKDDYEDFAKLANEQLIRSYEYLFLSAQFGTHLKDRPGFEKVLHGLSDNGWGKGIEMIKETAKRGGNHDFTKYDGKIVTAPGDVSEVGAMARAFDIEKRLLIEANKVHRHHSHATNTESKAHLYDADLAHFLQEEIIEEKTETVRKLVGYTNELKKLIKDSVKTFPLSLYLFDQYLQK